MKNKVFILSLIVVFASMLFTACNPNDEKICDNFAQKGISNKEALIGSWNFESFGYTINGNNIRKKEKKEKGYINITDTGKIWFYYTNGVYFDYFTEKNSILCQNFIGTEIGDIDEKETPLLNFFINSICYKIYKEKLYIHSKK